MELVSENRLGVSRGSAVEEEVKMNFKGECTEVGLYLAMARVAMRQGYPEIALALEKIAWEEAQHAAVFAEMNGMVAEDTKANLEKMLSGEQNANRGKREAAIKAKENGVDEAHDFFDVSARDEARHARALKALLDRYFG
ncbi:ferritin-like domain-containing protein [Candidatus Pyrohabitans sp.]